MPEVEMKDAEKDADAHGALSSGVNSSSSQQSVSEQPAMSSEVTISATIG